MKKYNENIGITLIALVVTILILLILAGISISMLTGQNNILNKAGQAKEETEKGKEKEYIKLATSNAKISENTGMSNTLEQEIQQELDNLLGKNKTKVIVDSGINVTFKESNRSYTLKDNGEINEINIQIDETPGDIKKGKDGETLQGDEESPYEIWSIEDLVEVSKNISEYKDSHINLMQDLDFTSKLSYTNYNETKYGDINKDGEIEGVIEELKKGEGFSQIANFAGVFDGKNHSLCNLYINKNQDEVAFIISNSGTVKNLIVKDGYIEGKTKIAGLVVNNSGTVENVKSGLNVLAEYYNAGIIYNNTGIVKNGTYSGKIENKETGEPRARAGNGGIVGKNSGKIESCINEGVINGGYQTGGIVGFQNSSGTVSRCINKGEFFDTFHTYNKGGIVGTNSGNSVVEYSYNLSNINFTHDSGHGGIAGENNENAIIQYCFNKGNLSQTHYVLGGIAGGNYATIKYCYNTGNISTTQGNASTSFAYGISNLGNIKNCYNIGKIIAPYSKTIADSDATIQNSYYLGTNTEDTMCKDSEFMKTQEFVDLLNTENEEAFCIDEKGINDGYPILSWQIQ